MTVCEHIKTASHIGRAGCTNKRAIAQSGSNALQRLLIETGYYKRSAGQLLGLSLNISGSPVVSIITSCRGRRSPASRHHTGFPSPYLSASAPFVVRFQFGVFRPASTFCRTMPLAHAIPPGRSAVQSQRLCPGPIGARCSPYSPMLAGSTRAASSSPTFSGTLNARRSGTTIYSAIAPGQHSPIVPIAFP